MAKFIRVATDEPALFDGDVQHRLFWRCETCGKPVTEARPGFARWRYEDEPTGEFSVVHQGACDDDTDTRTLDLGRFTESLARNYAAGLDG